VKHPALDRLTDLDKRIVVALQRDGRASWRTVAEVVGAPVTTVARRGQQLISDGVVRIAAVPALGAEGPYDSFWVRVNATPGKHIEVAASLAAHADVRFCTLVTGSYDVMAELVVRGGATRYPELITDLQSIEGVARWRSDLIMHVYKVSLDWGRQLYGEMFGDDEVRELSSASLEDCAPEHFDAADLAILDALRSDGRETFSAIAENIGLNESSVRRRFERMRAARCVDVLALVSSAALGMGAETLLTVTVAPDRLEQVAHELAAYPFVRYLAALLDENALLCEVIAPTVADIYTFTRESLAQLDGVRGWSANMELLYLKRGFVETPWWRAEVPAP
jgi:DNA-binding Lrp family transcriptional regulator